MILKFILILISCFVTLFFLKKTQAKKEMSPKTDNSQSVSFLQKEESSQTPVTNAMNTPKQEPSLFQSITKSITSTLENIQAEYEMKQDDDLVRYFVSLQGGSFFIDVREDRRCRVVFPNCFFKPVGEYNLVLEMLNDYNWFCSFTNAICFISDDEVVCNLYTDVEYSHDFDEFSHFLKTTLINSFHYSRFLQQLYDETKEHKLKEKADEDNLIEQAKTLMGNRK